MATYGTFGGDAERHPVPRSEAPWDKLKAESYSLFLKLSELPKGTYDEFEASWADEKENGAFKGGLGAVIVVRYTETPVGPYDEIIFVPGNFTTPLLPPTPSSIPAKALRISRIYVSQRTTTYNGRLNWNIPKHLARFTFSSPPTAAGASPPASLTVKVYPPSSQAGDSTPPFFACTLTPWTWIPALPVNTAYIPLNLTVVQPPIPEPPGHKEALKKALDAEHVHPYDTDPQKALAVLPGTDRWTAFDISARSPRARGCWVRLNESEQHAEAEGKVFFPDRLPVWSVGAWMEDVEWGIGAVTEWGDGLTRGGN
ncbi:hypothetical protein COCC4DRAFT_41318 [Bipolaris maydis ATCC 48331]|uniref:Uncharacterized protein n=2 Tax=Cochliobolus heterostrophus TaxID=5016 RepID=M2UGN1_COCH5|nr:uncharacterized protein COCC4DRAFT_41318 [Bipolaris maydis ATCC 48331]EMD87117.1 hypothetical protein COCHEDRAFT_1114760 [Bipolaris maydis C5]KAJ5021569.1 hypothetical protein J3E73DRAFT_402710 [Bipolaris maydis]ENI03889.1 hypothetical protein COCC4DRAFT_41318 [Bipolaris maydis ATCC 48331]KAJ6192843.1 hypothetical protein J3E72DRAFT_407296 [Bipolaris maydis]KAJ6204426.1 hypothetical protein PSV09DRAFT_1114760 [Bipolaris maydis]